MDGTRLLVVALVVLAGCGSLASGPDPVPEPDRTLTPAPVPEPTPTARDPLPPGVTGNGITDMNALVGAHAAALDNRSFTLRVRVVRDNRTRRRLLRVEGPRRYYYSDKTRVVDGTRTEFVSGRFRYVRTVEDPVGLQFDRRRGADYADRYGWVPRETVRSFLPVGNATVAETRVDGERRYELRADRDLGPGDGPRADYSVRATIRPDGFVESIDVTYVRPYTGGATNVTVSVRYSDVGTTTVDPPRWVSRRWTVRGPATGPTPTPHTPS